MKKGSIFLVGSDVNNARTPVAALRHEYSVQVPWAVFGVWLSLLFNYRKRPKQPDTTRIALQRRGAELQHLVWGSAGGSAPAFLLRRAGENVVRYKAGRLMQVAGLVSRQTGEYIAIACVTGSLLCRQISSVVIFLVNVRDDVCCGCVTFIRTRPGWL